MPGTWEGITVVDGSRNAADPKVNATAIFKPVEDCRIPGFRALDLPVGINGEKALLQNMPPRLGERIDRSAAAQRLPGGGKRRICGRPRVVG